MQYALVDGIRTKPAKGLKGICSGCKKEVTAKCGSLKVHHWAHKSLPDCDSWWEPETEWHLNWKEKFPEDYREVVFISDNGELHRADIHTPKGVTIEFQNSSISLDELTSRVKFYQKLIWVVNAQPFSKQISKYPIPDPEHPLLSEYEICGYSDHSKTFMEGKLQTNPDRFFGSLMLRDDNGMMYSLREKPFAEVLHSCLNTPVNFLFDWRNKRKAWLNCSAPVFFDFGGEFLHLLKYKKNPLNRQPYFKLIKNADFIKHYT